MKKCCNNCFKDYLFWRYIHKNGFDGKCDFCNQTGDVCIDLDDGIFVKMFTLISKMYIEMPVRRSKQLFSFIQDEWNVFSESTNQINLFNELCHIHGTDSETYYVFNPDYNRLADVWYEYKTTVKHKNRFINSLPEEIERLLSSPNERYKLLDKENTLFRARIGSGDEFGISPYPANLIDMGMPPINKARAGRANPDGIPYLYLASSQETALAEVRPWCGALVTIAKFQLQQSVNTINFSFHSENSLFDYLESENVENALNRLQFFNSLSYEMSQPISPSDSYIEYIPTQYLTEFIKNEGYDGIIFDSSLGAGQNVVLFNQDNVEVNASEIVKIGQIIYDFIEL
ncbi:RES domain-containing protein [Bacillus sp. OV322]|uniref:RES domain-containing protein n=1 Tax=Bacillus sp. OV322 TaxID=1882764 RepID=UPI0008EBD736|nr:RES domain-containing protein [Bacillus sp. OV322]SFD02164.1 RES domain-containing protein [Bacillus sp. OV322]